MPYPQLAMRTALALLLCVLTFAFGNDESASAQDLSNPENTTQIQGWLSILHGDPQDSTQAPINRVQLQTLEGQLLELEMAYEQALRYQGQFVSIVGNFQNNRWNVNSIAASSASEFGGGGGSEPPSLIGAQPVANLLCRFADYKQESRSPEVVQSLFSNTYPGLNHYWQEVSYSIINIDGTTTLNQWVTLPLPRNAYFFENGYINLEMLLFDCIAAADALLDFANFVGINMFFNAYLDCCSWGGMRELTLDGVTKIYRVTWIAEWGFNHQLIAHEMGHGYGFPHSTGPADNPPSELAIYVSNWDVMSRGADCTEIIEPFGCIAANTISFNLYNAAWLAAERRVLVPMGASATITLDRLTLPLGNENKLMVEVPIGDSPFYYYLIEVRGHNSYDVNNPAAGVIIHEVDRLNHGGNGGPAHVVDADDGNHDVNDEGGVWTVGETFTDSFNGISIEVLSAADDNSSYTVQVTNNSNNNPPENDTLETAKAFSTVPYVDYSTTRTASAENEPVSSCNFGAGRTIWYRFSPSESALYDLNTIGSGFNSILALWTGTANALSEIACNDDAVGYQWGASQLSNVFLEAGTTYYIMVSSYKDIFSESYGNVVFHADYAMNDTPASARPISQVPYEHQVTTYNFSAFDEPIPACGYSVGQTAWYRFTPSATAQYDFATANSNYDTVLSVWEIVSEMWTEIGCNDDVAQQDLSSRLSLRLNADTTYYIVVGAFNYQPGILNFQATLGTTFDMNGDEVVSPSDAVFVTNRLNQTITDSNLIADINHDGQITHPDVRAVFAHFGETTGVGMPSFSSSKGK